MAPGGGIAVIAVRALADAETLPRIAGLLAQRRLIPQQFSARRHGNRLFVDLQVQTESRAILDLLLAKLDALVLVERAWLVVRPG